MSGLDWLLMGAVLSRPKETAAMEVFEIAEPDRPRGMNKFAAMLDDYQDFKLLEPVEVPAEFQSTKPNRAQRREMARRKK